MTDLIGDRPSPVMTDLIGHLEIFRQIDYLCEKPDAMKMTGVLLAAALVCASCCMLKSGKAKSQYANTRWTSSYEMFVADAGTETTTVTLTFGPTNEFVLDFESHLPSHPAMYMNPDGTVPTIPGSSRSYTRRGTYEVNSDTIVLTNESGTTNTLRIDAPRLLAPDLTFEALVFEKEGEK